MFKEFKLMVLNGPNLNKLGQREAQWYGSLTLPALEEALRAQAQMLNVGLTCFQTNDEAAFIDQIHDAPKQAVDLMIINAGAWTHTSIAIRDALLAVNIPFIEVHLSNIYAREPFRHHSYFSDIAIGQICGFGAQGYHAALEVATQYLQQTSS